MKKMSKVMTTIGLIGGMVGIGAYMYMNYDKTKYKKYIDYIMKQV